LTTSADETGEFIGTHRWEEELLRVTGGDFLFLHVCISTCPRLTLISSIIQHVGLRQVLYNAAIAAGAEVRTGTTVTSVSGEGPRVTLASGEILLADVIVGADGCSSIVQQAIVGKNVSAAAPYQSLFYK
jgi:salicylate hydroxylase